MKASKWFACLPYGRIEILIPQFMIAESTYTVSEGKSILAGKKGLFEYNFDNFIGRIFSIENLGAPLTEMEIKGKVPIVLRTSVVPIVQQIKLCEMKVSSSILGVSLRKKGIVACRFYDKKIQYLVDIEKILGNDFSSDGKRMAEDGND